MALQPPSFHTLALQLGHTFVDFASADSSLATRVVVCSAVSTLPISTSLVGVEGFPNSHRDMRGTNWLFLLEDGIFASLMAKLARMFLVMNFKIFRGVETEERVANRRCSSYRNK